MRASADEIFLFANPNRSCKLTAMSVEQIEKTLLQLPSEERRRFADWFYEHESEILHPQDEDYIHPSVKAEILRRRDETIAHPELLEPWDGLKKVRERLNEIRRQKAPVR
jgi:hypothetical protein